MLAQALAGAKLIQEGSAKELTERLARRRQGALDKIAQAEAAAVCRVRQYAVDVAIGATQHPHRRRRARSQGPHDRPRRSPSCRVV